jgi:hypothetical protein
MIVDVILTTGYSVRKVAITRAEGNPNWAAKIRSARINEHNNTISAEQTHEPYHNLLAVQVLGGLQLIVGPKFNASCTMLRSVRNTYTQRSTACLPVLCLSPVIS